MSEQPKSCMMRFSLEGFARVLNMPAGIRLLNVFRDPSDIAENSFSVLIEGSGEPRVEGCSAKYVDSLTFASMEPLPTIPPDVKG